jgi:hypothetical protein
LDFDGTDDYVEVPHAANYLLDDGTVAFWFKTPNVTTQQGLWSKDSSGFDTGGHLRFFLETTSKVQVRLQSTTGDNYVTSTGTVAPNTWTHVTLSLGSAGMKLYLDAGTPDTNAYTGGLGTTSGGSGNAEPLVFGGSTHTSGDLIATPVILPFTGEIDDVRIYNRALSAAEISTLAASPPTACAAPTVTSVTPASGTEIGGTAVTITGTNFVSGATVTFGGVAATGVSVVNDTTITATTPAHAPGAVNVVVTNPDTQSGTLPNGYTYVAASCTSITYQPGDGKGMMLTSMPVPRMWIRTTAPTPISISTRVRTVTLSSSSPTSSALEPTRSRSPPRFAAPP